MSTLNNNDNGGGAELPRRGVRCRNILASSLKEKVTRVLGDRMQSMDDSDEDGTPSAHNGNNTQISDAASKGGDCESAKDNHWDLDSCIDVIETLSGLDGLTPEQQAAICNLRAASSSGSGHVPTRSFRNAKRREAKVFGFGSSSSPKDSPLMSEELLKLFHEVEDNKEDTDQQQNVTAVLANYGWTRCDEVFSITPHSEEKKNGNEDRDCQLDDESQQSSLNASLNLDSSQRQDSEHSVRSSGRRVSARRDGAVNIDPLDCTSSLKDLFVTEVVLSLKVYCPPEWNALTIKARSRLTSLLSWENLSKWDFDILDVANFSRQTHCARDVDIGGQFCPLLFVGWAILCCPMAQEAMEGSLGDIVEKEAASTTAFNMPCAYDFVTHLNINPESVCNFLRQVESGYRSEISYHNNIHAADVTQTLHCLLQFIDEDDADTIYQPVDIFSVLLAATFHDVGHRGTNNLFEKNAKTSLAIRYNDASILENMHSAVGHSLLMGEQKTEEWDIFKHWSDGQIAYARNVMMRSILGTDMSTHFESLGELTSLVEKVKVDYMEDGSTRTVGTRNGEDEPRPILSILAEIFDLRKNKNEDPLKKECSQLASLLLKFLLHAADISNSAKTEDLALYWGGNVISEFLAQGDKEKEMGLPISPLCDRDILKREESQINFIKFMIQPTFGLLGDIIPRVKDELMPAVDITLEYWKQEQLRLQTAGIGENKSIIEKE
mmetsp:Transcript_30701/g.53293  ORF Transcript_30701/g.53293 Transcript_30701/m.53293 type:complete len:721 (-) Transcript_30701:433-2595(-)